MLTCKYSLEIGGTTTEFNTIEELNEFIYNNYNRLEASLEGASMSFSKNLDNVEEVTAKLNEFLLEKGNYKPKYVNGIKTEGNVKDSYVGTTKYIESIKDERGNLLVKPPDMNAFFNKYKEEKKQEHIKNGMNDIDASTKAAADSNALQKSFDTIVENGNVFHKIAEIAFGDGNLTLEQILSKYEQDMNALPPVGDEAVNMMYSALLNIKDSIKNKLKDDDVTFFTEVPIFGEDKAGEKVMGILDLIAVDSKGNTHLFDFKTSFKKIADWDINKLQRYYYQLTIYKHLLNAKGINVVTTNLLPIEFNSVDNTRKDITNVRFEGIEDLGLRLNSDPYDKIKFHVEKAFPVRYARQMIKYSDTISKNQTDFFNESFSESLQSRIQHVKNTSVKYDATGKKFLHMGTNDKKLLTGNQEQDDEIIREFVEMKESGKYGLVRSLKDSIRQNIEGKIYYQTPLQYDAGRDQDLNSAVAKALNQYVHPNWEILDTYELETHGILTFRNVITNRIDFLILDDVDFDEVVKLNKGTTILGNFKTNHEIKDQTVSPSDRITIEAMKILTFLNENVEKFQSKEAKIGMIRAISNPTNPNANYRKVSAVNYQAIKSDFDQLLKLSKSDSKNKLSLLPSMKAEDQLLEEIQKTLNSELAKNEKNKTTLTDLMNIVSMSDIRKDVDSTLSQLIAIQKKLDSYWYNRDIENLKFNPDSGMDLVTGWLNVLIANLAGFDVGFESETMVRDGLTNSKNWSTKDEITVETVRKAMEPLYAAMNHAQELYQKNNEKYRKKFDAYYEAKGTSRLLGDHTKSYRNLYERDAKGNLTPEFRFKNPWDNSNDLTKLERDLLKELLPEINAMLRDDRPLTPDDPDYFNVPLLQADSASRIQAHGIGDFTKGVARKATNEFLGFVNILEEQRSDNRSAAESGLVMFNKYNLNLNSSNRLKAIENNGIEMFEQNLEVLYGDMFYTKTRERLNNKILPIVKAITVGSYLLNKGYTTKDTSMMNNWIKDQVKTVIFEEKLIAENQEEAARSLSKVKNVVSMLQLGLAPLNLVRESLQGYFTNLGRIWANQYGEGGPGVKEFHQALGIMASESPDFIKNVTLVEELNHMYGMADMDRNRLVDKMKTSKTGISQFFSRWMLWFQSAPDYMTRMTFFLAKMIKDGSYKAHTFKDGELVYDWKKDERFSLFAKGDAGKAENEDKYNFQRQLYLTMLKDMNEESRFTGAYGRLNEDENLGPLGDLPKAYTSKERNSIKDYINWSHGSYDHGDQVQVSQTLFGILALQFKTWMIAKKRQWYTKGSNKTTQGAYEHMKDSEGNLLYRTFNEYGEPILTIEPNDDPAVEWKGKYMEGILQSFIRTYEMISSGDGLLKGLQTAMKDKTIAANLKMAASDVGFYMLFGLLIKGLIDWDELKENNILAHGILDTAFYAINDLNILNTVSSVMDNSLFPTFSAMSGMVGNMFGIISGDVGFMTMLKEPIGAVRTIAKFIPED